MKEYLIYIDKVNTSVIRVPARNKRQATKIAERFIDDVYEENLDINKIIKFNPEYKIKVKQGSTHGSAFFNGIKRWKH